MGDQARAHHEAGHAVAASALGLSLWQVSMEGSGLWLRRTECRRPSDWYRPDVEIDTKTRLRLEKEIMVSLAGPEVQHMWFPNEPDEGAAGDHRQAAQFAEHMMRGDPAETSAYVEWLRHRTVRLVHTWLGFQPCVEALTEALVEHRTLSGRRAARLIRTAGQRFVGSRRDNSCGLQLGDRVGGA